MKFNKGIISVLVSAALVSTSLPVFATNSNGDSASKMEVAMAKSYMKLAGVVEDILMLDGKPISYIIKDENGNQARFVINKDTYLNSDEKISVGSKILGFYDSSNPETKIFPPAHTMKAIVMENEDENVMLSTFNDKLVNTENNLKLNITEQTKIFDSKGKGYMSNDLSNKTLLVFYKVTTKSAPPITIPSTVIVFEDAMTNGNEMTNEYMSFTGKISKVRADEKTKTTSYTLTEKNGDVKIFIAREETYMATAKTVKDGDEVTIYSKTNSPVGLSLPPQYRAEVIVVKTDAPDFVKVDKFDEDMLSSDKGLKLNVNSETNVVDAKGEKFTDKIANHDLVVYYGVTTRSMPPQTAPTKIVVLNKMIGTPRDTKDVMPEAALPEVIGFTGKVERVENSLAKNAVEKTVKYFVRSTDQAEVVFVANNDTFFVNGVAPKTGDTITGFYKTKLPIIAIYPPQYPVVVIANASDKSNVKVDLFDSGLLSSDKELKLNVSKDTPMFLTNGERYMGTLENKMLVVEYTVTTMSIPAQTTPTKITVLNPGTTKPVEKNDDTKTAPMSMIKLRKACDDLGHKIGWDDKTRTVTVDDKVKFVIGKDFIYVDDKEVKLSGTIILKDEMTYVPSDFFQKAFGHEISPEKYL